MQKLLVLALALAANLMVQWYAHNSGKISSAGSIFGWTYNSDILAATFFALKFVWLLVLLNVLTALASKYGQVSFDSFVIFILIFIAMGPISTLIYNAVVTKEPVNSVHIIGVLFIFAGATAIAANKEILAMLK
jgi:hypothetical protein